MSRSHISISKSREEYEIQKKYIFNYIDSSNVFDKDNQNITEWKMYHKLIAFRYTTYLYILFLVTIPLFIQLGKIFDIGNKIYVLVFILIDNIVTLYLFNTIVKNIKIKKRDVRILNLAIILYPYFLVIAFYLLNHNKSHFDGYVPFILYLSFGFIYFILISLSNSSYLLSGEIYESLQSIEE